MEKSNVDSNDVFDNPSVQDVIDRLMKVPDRSLPFNVDMLGEDGFYIDYTGIEFTEYYNTDGTPSSVSMEVKFTVPVKQLYDTAEDADEEPRLIDYCGEMVVLHDYEERHRPENQPMIQGVPFNPRLRKGFDSTPNDDRDTQEVDDWWGRPFIRSTSWADRADAYCDYIERVSPPGLVDFTPMTREEFDADQEARRIKWFESWPTGVRYDVRCLDGGAWDRSTSLAMVGSLEDALDIARSMSDVE